MREYALKTIFILAMLLQLGFAQDEYGCTDPEACNYNPDAAIDDGSCLYFDCFGECGGDALEDCAGICAGTTVMDCMGVCEGNSQIDDCGVCDGYNEDMDCAGVCFGDAYVDDCGVCDNIPYNDNETMDCSGVCGGDAVEDCTGVCEGTSFEDCTGVCDGDAYVDDCGICDDNINNDNVDMDCAGECYGGAYENECGCVGGSTGHVDDYCYGCTDPNADNYDPNAIFACDGDNNCCEYSPPVYGVELTFGSADYQNGILELRINSFVDVSSFDIEFYNVNIINVSDGLTEEYNYNIVFEDNIVHGESQIGINIPPENDTFFFIELDNPAYVPIFITNVIFQDENNEEILVNFSDVFEWSPTGAWGSCEDLGLYTDCDGICFEEIYLGWHGDGFCDDDSFAINLFCDSWNYDSGDCSGDPLTYIEFDNISDDGWFTIESTTFAQSNGQPLTVQVGQPLIIGDGGEEPLPEPIINNGWYVFLSITNIEENILEISMNNTEEISGFQFTIITSFENFTISGATGGSAGNSGFMISTNNEGLVLGFSLTGSSIDEIETCNNGQFSDCDDNCYPASEIINIDNGVCDEELPNLNCAKWWYDDGSCLFLPSDDLQYYNNLLNGDLNNYLNFYDSTGLGQFNTFTVESVEGGEAGDEIGLLDYNGIIDIGGCEDDTGEILVGAGIWNDESLAITAFGSMDFCDDNENNYEQFPGWITNNPMILLYWKASENKVYPLHCNEYDEMFLWSSDDLVIPALSLNDAILYDANLDCDTNILDIMLIVNYVLEDYGMGSIQSSMTDTNSDSNIDVLDIVAIIEFILME
ncbi:MAG: hypothetical protein HN729_05465 [Candidatus Marinimicrobia bacterium]|jgi:hypothetical protein|nr:hypothetical protein [Candidatus Neomarinimicrobiota bacterium]MBT3634377.1 hypothetical protein [Candidatus Neomarinimicrobiota bacterium]MBT3681714.1 hypothetical protein [Candidatus Neomarinimicrobiota bacterium]MBT3759440.1 hypothetical protein [Candidatus Neomarinimicrobiota bacterium]MBT3895928.1 hypothetical protein [Candidatus Neomarinimicrobiota bacterium]